MEENATITRVQADDYGDVSDLADHALKQPGVRELMEVYQSWRIVEEAAQPHRQYLGLRRIVSLSDNSEPRENWQA